MSRAYSIKFFCNISLVVKEAGYFRQQLQIPSSDATRHTHTQSAKKLSAETRCSNPFEFVAGMGIITVAVSMLRCFSHYDSRYRDGVAHSA